MPTHGNDVRLWGESGSHLYAAKSTRLTQSSPHIGIAVDPSRKTPNKYVKAAARIRLLIRSAAWKRYPRIGHRAIITSSASVTKVKCDSNI